MEFYKQLPKVELHAHINGSIGPDLLQKLVNEYEAKRPGEIGQEFDSILAKLQSTEMQDMTLAECFLAFKCIHRVSGDEESVGVCYGIETYCVPLACQLSSALFHVGSNRVRCVGSSITLSLPSPLTASFISSCEQLRGLNRLRV